MSAGPMVHARERSALAESWPDPQPTAPTLRCCRQHSKNQLVHTSQVLLSHGARLVHRNLRGTRSSRCRATADSTRMTSGSRHAPHFSLGHHDSRPPPRCARFVETKKNDIVDETAELARTPAMPDVSQETLYPDVLQPRGGALQCSSPQCNLVILVTPRQSCHSCHIASVTPTASRRVAPRHTGHRVTRKPQRVRPPDSGLRARGGGAVKLCLPPGNNGRGFEEGHLHRFTWHTHPQQTYSDEPISAPTRC